MHNKNKINIFILQKYILLNYPTIIVSILCNHIGQSQFPASTTLDHIYPFLPSFSYNNLDSVYHTIDWMDGHPKIFSVVHVLLFVPTTLALLLAQIFAMAPNYCLHSLFPFLLLLPWLLLFPDLETETDQISVSYLFKK